VHPAVVATTFATIFVAELPDKTMMANVVLSARYKRPLAVWFGAATALTTQVVIAVVAGHLLNLLPDRVVAIAVTVLFAVGAVVLWRSSDDPVDEVTTQGVRPNGRLPGWRVSATVFGVVFLAEWGDLTQLATASLASRGDALSVFVGAAAAMVTVAAIGVVAGRSLQRVLPERVLRRVAALIFATLAVVALVSAIRG
jgi:putative Ca2+/H+ antiporter (TMEM165/GDT1 family)